MYIDQALNSHNLQSKKPLDIEALAKTFMNKKSAVTNPHFKVNELDGLRPRQIGIEK